MLLSVVLPFRNEEEVIPEAIQRVTKAVEPLGSGPGVDLRQ